MAATSRWQMLRNGSYKDLLPVDNEPRDTTEQATAGSRMWDKLLMATGSVSKTIASRIKDTGYDSADDEEGVETHVIKCLKDYYTNKGEGVPTWLGGSGTMAMPQSQQQEYGHRAAEGGRSGQEPSQGMTRSATGTMRNKVTLRGIYEQAQERTSHQQQQPTSASSAATRLSPQRLDTSMTRQRSAPQDLSPGAAAGGGSGVSAYGRTGLGQPGPGAGGVSAGERFRERMKLNRAASAGGHTGAAGASGGGGGDPRLRRGGEGSRF